LSALPAIRSLPLLSQGKVRSNYAVGSDRLLMVASDRLSAYDVIMAEPIPGKGALLTQMALFWFARLGPGGAGIVPHHLTGIDPESVVLPEEREAVRGRSMVVKRLKPLPIEAVVRGYLAGSGWAEYQKTQSVCGVPLPPGLRLAAKLPEPIFTPATKAEAGAHDENISFEQAAAIVGPALAQQVKDVSIRLYQAAAAHAAERGILIADTKFEFGLDAQGSLTLMDEVLTPDSSRFWPADTWADSVAQGLNPPSYDKQFVRDYLDSVTNWGRTAPPPPLPQAVIDGTVARYQEALRRLTA
jgi:phosphoribosylaminoimidazole-succinocarboxamide synthase